MFSDEFNRDNRTFYPVSRLDYFDSIIVDKESVGGRSLLGSYGLTLLVSWPDFCLFLEVLGP